jgi:hypothetical protein
MLFTSIDVNPRIDVSKPLLVAEKASVSASLSTGEEGLRYRLNAYGSGFRKAGFEGDSSGGIFVACRLHSLATR